MTKRIEEFVSENRRKVNQIDSTFVSISGQQQSDYTFSNNVFKIKTSVRVYNRDLDNSLISGHPNGDRHGSGHGESGDLRTNWTLTEDTEQSSKFVVDGRNIVANGLSGNDGSFIGEIAVGDGSSDAQTNDVSLESENGRTIAFPNVGINNNQTIAKSLFLFQEYGDSISEYGVLSQNGSLYNRITTYDINPTNEKELRVEIEFEVEGQSLGPSVITDVGEKKVAESLRALDSPIGLEKTNYGTGNTSATPSDTSLENEVIAKNSARNVSSESVTAITTVFGNEPNTQPHDISEIGVISKDGSIFWRTTIDPIKKDSDTEFSTRIRFRIE